MTHKHNEGYNPFLEKVDIQEIGEKEEYKDFYPVYLSSGQGEEILELPIIQLDPDIENSIGIALFYSEQADLEIIERLNLMLCERLYKDGVTPDVVVGIPTLGLCLARGVAKNLHHKNYVPLSTSKKAWQNPKLRTDLLSSTSTRKSMYLDQSMLQRLQKDIGGETVVIVDDVINTASSMIAAIELVKLANPKADIHILVTMTEGHDWEQNLERVGFNWQSNLHSLGHIPVFTQTETGLWKPLPETL
ncbi:hypothetical protein COV24_00600 [candidate division WWE3 bacterium CG10_big_fil_rev_8_21_14_0_10_32_10]|uniref:Phosphoribosyltransferase domain-containing protein n=1 Tax=candidate division WWE3 bacterium CG10_big_fil_rev_8_21_14_0_10_32_10 TaxID=1975090 RepID=A0A2H0RBV1_UNCKA|nr:MAG: hypothetical protein COV24_00600 [candidate division WWE3 bacterium CG10_big_fil_rev_8_21_14_0_10_32_10]